MHIKPNGWPQIAKIIFKKKNKVGGLTLPDFKPYYKAIIISVILAWGQTYRPME